MRTSPASDRVGYCQYPSSTTRSSGKHALPSTANPAFLSVSTDTVPGLERTATSEPRTALPSVTANIPANTRSCSRTSGVPVRRSPPSGNIGIETSGMLSQPTNGKAVTSAIAYALNFIACDHPRIREEAGRIRQEDPERVVRTGRHCAEPEVPNRVRTRRVLDEQHFAVPGEQARVVEPAPHVADAHALGPH